ncbi:peptide MFS transporter [Sandarakinorhabdus limnophila]|uniref:peptide MFS transporter n=1 Tax=Sandarakinorhabdus limnophila TaxID=210512 RepID=UPI0026ED45B4|nr:peptide MFS transporter [Sandarakinorhabdus limnophila]
MSDPRDRGPGNRTDWFGQPRGLTILFLTEMWEKFSFFGMRALLVYYMVKALGFGGPQASLVYGLYAGFVYLTPILGGAISDRWLGRRRAVIIGGSLMVIGHFMMAFPALFFPALAAIALGNGFYLPNLASQIDRLYAPADARRGGAYNVYYVGVNIGGFLAPLVCGTLGELYGWHWGFGVAGVGMAAGLAIYILGGRWLPAEPARRPAQIAAAEPLAAGTLRLMIGVLLAVVIFRCAYEQLGNSVALWADADVDRRVGSFIIPGSWFQSLNPLLVFLVTPLLVRRWARAAEQGREPPALRKMALGGGGLMLAFLGLAAIVVLGGVGVHWLWLAAFITAYTIAELHILPVGLGLFARLAPPGHEATTIAAWFLASFAGNLLAGALGALWTQVDHAAFFVMMAGCGAVAGAVLLGLARSGWRAAAD